MSTKTIYVPSHRECDIVTIYQGTIAPFIEFNSARSDIEFCDSPNQADIVVAFEEFSYKTWEYANILREHEFVKAFAHKIFVVNYDDYGRGYLPGLYTSLTRDNYLPCFHKPCCYPNTYNQHALEHGSDQPRYLPKWLFSFSGTVRSHPVRAKIYKTLSSVPEARIRFVDQPFHSHSASQKREYINEILESAFVLCPRGWSPTTYRLFEVMSLGRCPLIISDDWVPIPGIDWDDCSIRILEKDVRDIPKILRARAGEYERLGRNALRVSTEKFSVPMRYRGYLDMILELHDLARPNGISLETLSRVWGSYEFRYSNGWTIPQRVLNRVKNAIRKKHFS